MFVKIQELALVATFACKISGALNGFLYGVR